MATTNPPTRFIMPTGTRCRPEARRAIPSLILTGLLLVTAACGDFQDPASGVQGAHSTYPALTQVTSQQTRGDERDIAPPPTEYPGDQVSRPLSADSRPSSTDVIGTGGNTTINQTTSEPAPSLPAPETIHSPNQGPANPTPQTLTWEKPETQSITFEWNPSQSGNAAGYTVRVSSMSTVTHYTFKTGQETRLVVDLPRGESYIATVLAYNVAGESLPAEYIRFDLF